MYAVDSRPTRTLRGRPKRKKLQSTSTVASGTAGTQSPPLPVARAARLSMHSFLFPCRPLEQSHCQQQNEPARIRFQVSQATKPPEFYKGSCGQARQL